MAIIYSAQQELHDGVSLAVLLPGGAPSQGGKSLQLMSPDQKLREDPTCDMSHRDS